MIQIGIVEYNGRTYILKEWRHRDYDRNTWVSGGDCRVTYDDTGEEVNALDLHKLIAVPWQPAGMVSVFDHLCHEADWKSDYNEEE